MSICTDPAFDCGETKEATIAGSTTFTYTQSKNRVSTLTVGTKDIVLNSRVREYRYEDAEGWSHTDHKWVIYPDGFGVAWFECYGTGDTTNDASISDSYQTVDTEVLFVDLRYDIIVYRQTTKSMHYEDTRDFTIPLQTSFDDAHLYPFIFEQVPIQINEKLIYSKAGVETVLEETNSTSGYYDDINLLMPLFSPGTNPRPTFFTLPAHPPYRTVAREYLASEVDWYYPLPHREQDGDMFLYYPEWLRAVGIYGDLDQAEATARYAQSIGAIGNPASMSSDDNLQEATEFDGSVVVDPNDRVFYSIRNGNKVFNALTDGVLSNLLPKYTITWKLYPIGLS